MVTRLTLTETKTGTLLSLECSRWPNKSPEPTAILSDRSFGMKVDGAVSWRSQRRHEMVARQETFASRTVVANAVHVASRRWLSFLR
jgi:hypothetical protein